MPALYAISNYITFVHYLI